MESILRRAFVLWCLTFTAQASLLPARAQTRQPDSAAHSCVSPEMARLIVQSRVAVRVNSPSQGGNDATAVRDNASGIIATKAPETGGTSTEPHNCFLTATRT